MTSSNMGILGGKRATSSSWIPYSLWINNSNKLAMRGSQANNGDTFIPNVGGSTSLTTGVWYHVALVKNGTTATIFLDGSVEAIATASGSPQNTANAFMIGATALNGFEPFNGWIDEVRVSNVARYTSAFSPPTAPFS